MTKRELVIEVSEKLGYTQNEVSAVVQATLDTITAALVEGSRLEIRNFGVFELKIRDARTGRNPRTGEAVPIEQKRVAVFKPGKALKELVESRIPKPDLSLPDEHAGPVESSPTSPPDGEQQSQLPF